MAAPEHFQLFARYNAWANARLYDAVAALSPQDFARDLGGFFGSLRGTLNHNLVGDLIWLQRLTGEGEAPERPGWYQEGASRVTCRLSTGASQAASTASASPLASKASTPRCPPAQ